MKIDDLSLWQAFYWVAKDSSFTKAAQRMNLGSPILSKKIAKLEETLDVRLFQRSTRKVSLTDEGKGLLPLIESLIDDVQGIEMRFEKQTELSGTIRMTSMSTIVQRFLAPILIDFTKKHPKVRFELDVSDHIVDMIDSQVDLAIRSQTPTGSDFVYKKLVSNRPLFCASPEYLKQSKKPVRKIEDLHHHRIMMFKAYTNRKILNTPYKLSDFADSKFIEPSSGLFITELILRGAGIGVRSGWDVHDLLKSGELVEVLKNYKIDPLNDIYLVVPNRRLLAPRVRAFIDFLVARAKDWPE